MSATPLPAEAPKCGLAAVAAAEALFTSDHLPAPYIPPEFVDELREISPALFSTRAETPDPYAMPAYLGELEDGGAPSYLVLGYAGYGIVSQAVHWYASAPHAAVLMQVRLDPFTDDLEQARQQPHGALQLARMLWNVMAEVRRADRWPPGRQLIAVRSDFQERIGWAWAPEGPCDLESITLAPCAGSPFTGAILELKQLLKS